MGKIKETLVELVVRNFVDARNKKTKRTRNNKRRYRDVSRHKSSIATIITNIVINSLKESTETEEKQTSNNLEHTAEESEGKKESTVHGGYGTIKPYVGMLPYVKYTDYNEIWNHLGAFRTNNAYGNAERISAQIAMDNGESSREMVSYETINKAEKHFKYFVMGELMGEVGLVPPVGVGIDSKDWEKYRLMTFMSIYRPLLKLMRSMA